MPVWIELVFNVTPSDFMPKKDALYSLLHTEEQEKKKRIDNIYILIINYLNVSDGLSVMINSKRPPSVIS